MNNNNILATVFLKPEEELSQQMITEAESYTEFIDTMKQNLRFVLT